MRPKILAIGRIAVETDMHIPYLPSAGHTISGKSISRFPSGSGVNTAIALNKLCADAVLSGKVGDDPNGRQIARFLTAQNVDVRYVGRDSLLPTGGFVRITEDSGAKRCLSFDGADAHLSPEDVDFAYKSYPMGAIVEGDIPDDALLAAVFYGARDHVPVLLNAAVKWETRNSPFPISELKPVEIFLIDGDNAARLTGIEPSSLEKSLKCCIALSGMLSAKYYVLKLEERGTFLYDGMYHRVVPAYDVENAGCYASDNYYTAALFAKYLMSGDIKAGAEFAAIAEAAGKQRIGGADALPSASELRSFMKENALSQ